MRWTRGNKSQHVEDRRGQKARVPGGVKGVGGLGLVVMVVLAVVFKQDLGSLLGGATGGGGAASQAQSQEGATSGEPIVETAEERELVDMVTFVLDDIQATWDRRFRERGTRYQFSTLVLYREGTPSGCGYGSAAIGPFYCPADSKVYLDLSFFETMRKRLGAPGDFAQAYIIGHEIGHHIQNLTGVNARVDRESRADPGRKNDLSVRQELQADCYAGVWASSPRKTDLLERGDLEEGLTAAFAIGDDTLQKGAGRNPNPESFTHGSSEQRVRWFRRGFDRGDMDACDTFAAGSL